jgi:AcrR family transcriptional regulator
MKTRLRADERRDEILAAATIEFAAGGLTGTPTELIAERSGVSQPYLFQLFGTKKELFLATVRSCFGRTARRFEEAAADGRSRGLEGPGLLEHMGHAYMHMLLADRNLLRLQLNAYAACGDAEIRKVVREEYFSLWRTVERVSGADPADLREWFAAGMLINTIASITDAQTLDEFIEMLCGGVPPTS